MCHKEKDEKTKRQKNNVYSLIDKSEWTPKPSTRVNVIDPEPSKRQEKAESTSGESRVNDVDCKDYPVKDYKFKDISKDILKVSYGNEDINKLIEHYQQTIGGSLDGTQKENRQYANLLINRFKKDYPNRDTVELIKILISKGVEDSFHGKNLTTFKYLYYNAGKIIASAKIDSQKNRVIKI